MKFTVNNQKFQEAIEKIASIATPKEPATAQAVTVTADEFAGITLVRVTPEASINVTIEDAEVSEEGFAVVNYERLQGAANQSKCERISISSSGTKMQIEHEITIASLPLWTTEEKVPAEHAMPNGRALSLEADRFLTAMRSAERGQFIGAGKDTCRGVVLRKVDDKLMLAGVDGRRLHLMFLRAAEGEGYQISNPVLLHEPGAKYDGGLMMSKETQHTIKKILQDHEGEFTIIASGQTNQVSMPGVVYRFASLQTFPQDFSMFLKAEKFDYEITVDRPALLSAVRRSLPFGEGEFKSIIIKCSPKSITVQADDKMGSVVMTDVVGECTSKQDEFVQCSGSYFIDMLESIEEDKPVIKHLRGGLHYQAEDRYILLMLQVAK